MAPTRSRSTMILLFSLVLLSTFTLAQQAMTISSGRDGQCLSLVNGDSTAPYDGAQIVAEDCSIASGWFITQNQAGSIILAANSSFALDVGTTPGDFTQLKIWQSYPGLMQQTWYYTGDFRVALFNGNQCVDEGDEGPQLYQCTTGDGNQVWYAEAITYCS